MKRQRATNLGRFFPVFFLVMVFLSVNFLQAQEVGKVYNNSNYHGIKDLLTPALKQAVKRGEFSLMVGKFDFPLKLSDGFHRATQENEGKFGLDPNGHLISTMTGEFPNYNVYGFPFLKLDPKDPKVAEKIIWNFMFQKFRFMGSTNSGTGIQLIDRKRRHRFLKGLAALLYWQGRTPNQGIDNPRGYLSTDMQVTMSPMDMKGVALLSFEFLDPKKDSVVYSYVPAIRRVRQLTGTARSDKVFGTDGCLDFNMMFQGKIATFKWRYLGEREILACFTHTRKVKTEEYPDGTVLRDLYHCKFGYESPEWGGVSWAPIPEWAVWVPRPVWVIEATPMNPYYNFGKYIMYIDKDLFIMPIREDFDRSCAFWQWMMLSTHMTEAPSGRNTLGDPDYFIIIDEKIRHASINVYTPATGDAVIFAPASRLGPRYYVVENMLRMSK